MLRLMCALWILFACLAGMAEAQAPKRETRVALVIGNGNYEHTSKLPTPAKDAGDIAVALELAGFTVIRANDIDKRQFDRVLRGFVEAIDKADVALLYYAGHGIQIADTGYLVPVDASLKNERDAPYEAIQLEFVLREMVKGRQDRTSIVMLDACRDNPLTRSMASPAGTRSLAGGGLPEPTKGLGTGLFVAFATEPGKVALDQEQGSSNSPFTRALLQEMLVRGRSISDTMIAVRNAVSRATNGQQVPWDQSSLTRPFAFMLAAPAGEPVPPATPKESDEVAALKKRLADLEAQQKRWAEEREKEKQVKVAVPSPPVLPPKAEPRSTPKFNVRLGMRVVGELLTPAPSTANCESRCQAEPRCVAWNLSRDGECELLSGATHRVSAANWRSGVRLDIEETLPKGPAAPQIAAPDTGARTEASLTCSAEADAKRLTGKERWDFRQKCIEDFKKAAAQGPTPGIPPVIPKPGPPPKVSPDFEERENVGLLGVEIGQRFRAPSPIACRQACEANPTCVGYQHGRRIPVAGQCELFSRIDARREDLQWRSGVKLASAPKPAAPPTSARGCLSVPQVLTEPIPLTEGAKLCNGAGQNEARVERISELAVEFRVAGGRDFACKPRDVCQFDWPGSPSPYFQVIIGTGAKPTAQIVPRQR